MDDAQPLASHRATLAIVKKCSRCKGLRWPMRCFSRTSHPHPLAQGGACGSDPHARYTRQPFQVQVDTESDGNFVLRMAFCGVGYIVGLFDVERRGHRLMRLTDFRKNELIQS